MNRIENYFSAKEIAKRNFDMGGFDDELEKLYNEDNFEQFISITTMRADNGDASSQYNSGIFFEIGVAEHRDDALAEQYYRLAANQGHVAAQFCLGVIMAADLMRNAGATGLRPDLTMTIGERNERLTDAYKWLLIASRSGHSEAKVSLRNLKKELSNMQITLAENHAAEFQRRSINGR